MARAVAVGMAHHITQRGNYRQTVFFDDGDRQLYLAVLQENASRYRLRLLGFCLMSNHVHLIAVPEREDSLACALGRTHADYARWLHIRQRQTGHLWQNRFYSCPLDHAHCWAAMRYVERNPVRAGMVETAWQWPGPAPPRTCPPSTARAYWICKNGRHVGPAHSGNRRCKTVWEKRSWPSEFAWRPVRDGL